MKITNLSIEDIPKRLVNTLFLNFASFYQHVSVDNTVKTVVKGVAIADIANPVITLTDSVLGHVILGIEDRNVTRVCKIQNKSKMHIFKVQDELHLHKSILHTFTSTRICTIAHHDTVSKNNVRAESLFIVWNQIVFIISHNPLMHI